MKKVWTSLQDVDEYRRVAYPNGVSAVDFASFEPFVVLDMSCGAFGAQAKAIRKAVTCRLVGFDLPNVVGMMQDDAKAQYDLFTDSFNVVIAEEPHVVVAIHAVQHYTKVDIAHYFSNLKSHVLWILTRCWNDDGGDYVHDLIEPFYDISSQTKQDIEAHAKQDREFHWLARLRTR